MQQTINHSRQATLNRHKKSVGHLRSIQFATATKKSQRTLQTTLTVKTLARLESLELSSDFIRVLAGAKLRAMLIRLTPILAKTFSEEKALNQGRASQFLFNTMCEFLVLFDKIFAILTDNGTD